jgi:glutamine synthetase adenylyltransferase
LRITASAQIKEDRLFFKTGKGGLIGVEFLIQYLQMKHQVRGSFTVGKAPSIPEGFASSRFGGMDLTLDSRENRSLYFAILNKCF